MEEYKRFQQILGYAPGIPMNEPSDVVRSAAECPAPVPFSCKAADGETKKDTKGVCVCVCVKQQATTGRVASL